jgi:SAM-dependent methyltransferase
MYRSIKNVLKKLVPRKLLFRYEPAIRSVYHLFYRGNTYLCAVCEERHRKFISAHSDLICPRCGSLSRTRRLFNLIDERYLKPGIAILDFSPSRSFYRKMKKGGFNYLSSDLSDNFISDVAFDITGIDVENNHFDLILCYHILEHVEQDKKAMNELYRVLRPGGHCVVQTPFKEGNIYEDYSIRSSEERLKHFGQDDHVRIYSVDGLKSRLEDTGFDVEVLHFHEVEHNINGYHESEVVLVCRK